MLNGSRCDCGKVSVPPSDRCPACGKSMTLTKVDGRGKLLSFTTIHIAPEGFETPRTVALVELESGARVLALATTGEDHELDSDVEVVEEDGELILAK